MSTKKFVWGFILFLFLAAATLALREYLLLKRIQSALKEPSPFTEKQVTKNTPPSKEKDASLSDPEESDTPAPPPSTEHAFAYGVKRDGGIVTARVRFSAFKKAVEKEPKLLRQWGSLGWKVLGDTPALCIRRLSAKNPFTVLGVAQGECITHIDGETVNQPMRNLRIWLALGGYDSLRIDTLRAGKRITYRLTKG